MPLTVTVNTIAECLRTDCNILGDNKKNLRDLFFDGTRELVVDEPCGRNSTPFPRDLDEKSIVSGSYEPQTMIKNLFIGPPQIVDILG